MKYPEEWGNEQSHFLGSLWKASWGMWLLSWMQGQENDRKEGVCTGTEVCEGTASSLGAEDSGCALQCLGVESWQVQDESHRLGCTVGWGTCGYWAPTAGSVSMCRFWYLWGSGNQPPMDIERWLYLLVRPLENQRSQELGGGVAWPGLR